MNPAIRRWQDRLHDPALTALLIIESIVTFVLLPLHAVGLAGPRLLSLAIPLVLIAIVVLLSHSTGARMLVIVSVVLTAAGHLMHPPALADAVSGAGLVLARVALGWVVAAAVFAPGRITHYRIQGAIVLYLNFGLLFAVVYRLIAELSPGAFTGLPAQWDYSGSLSNTIYFSLATLTTSGYGDIVPVHPLARSLANLEAIIGALYPATLLARIVTLELAHRDPAPPVEETPRPDKDQATGGH